MSNELEQEALRNPKIGDYWHEMYCPYFLIVDINYNEYTILSCLNRNNEPCAKIDNKNDTWSFDFTKSMKVNHEWIKKTVKYSSIDGFVARVVRNNTFLKIAQDWARHESLDQSQWNLL